MVSGFRPSHQRGGVLGERIHDPSHSLVGETPAAPRQRLVSTEGDGPGPSKPGKRKAPGKRKSSAKKYRGEDLSVKENGLFTKNRKGFDVCIRFNKGACGNGKPQSKCPASRSHQCNKCLGPHTAQECKGKQN